MVELGPNSKRALLNSSEYMYVKNKLINGDANLKSSSFDVNLTYSLSTFHIGDTNVNYYTSCTTGDCVTRFEAFVDDGFYDPLDIGVDYIIFPFAGMNTVPTVGVPYSYKPYVFRIKYKNPNYVEGVYEFTRQ